MLRFRYACLAATESALSAAAAEWNRVRGVTAPPDAKARGSDNTVHSASPIHPNFSPLVLVFHQTLRSLGASFEHSSSEVRAAAAVARGAVANMLHDVKDPVPLAALVSSVSDDAELVE